MKNESIFDETSYRVFCFLGGFVVAAILVTIAPIYPHLYSKHRIEPILQIEIEDSVADTTYLYKR